MYIILTPLFKYKYEGLSFIFDAYLDLWCVNVPSNNSANSGVGGVGSYNFGVGQKYDVVGLGGVGL